MPASKAKRYSKASTSRYIPAKSTPSWGPNGSGKSTLSGVLAGDPRFTVTAGSADFHGVDLLSLSPEDRSHEGLFLSFQYPVEIPGVSMVNFMRAAVNAKRKYFGEAPLGR